MNIQERMAETEQKFNKKKVETKEHEDAAQESKYEMERLRGEYRLLAEMEGEVVMSEFSGQTSEVPKDEANIINVEPESEPTDG